MLAPDRVIVPTCIGCGAMGRYGTCDTGCRERRLDLVRAAAYESLRASRVHASGCADAFEPVVARLACDASDPGDCEIAYRRLQADARAALRSHPENASTEFDEPAEPVTTWWCPDCGGLEAPQPCLGICIWRPVEWVNRDVYERERERERSESDRELRLRRLVRKIAFVTPRAGQWQRTMHVLRADARLTLQWRDEGRLDLDSADDVGDDQVGGRDNEKAGC